MALTREQVERLSNSAEFFSGVVEGDQLAELCRHWLATQWQPIETAPTDIRILLCDETAGQQFVGIRYIGGWWKSHMNTPEGAWRPTKWMPLPVTNPEDPPT